MTGDALTRNSRIGSGDFVRSPAALVLNVQARSGAKKADQIEKVLARAGLEFQTVKVIRRPALLPQAFRSALASGARFVVVGGGDGTVSCAANQLLDSNVVMGLIPLGTGNDFARGLGIPVALGAAVEVLATGRLARVDVGVVGQKAFLNAASLGLSTLLTQKLSARSKRTLGKAAYPLAAARALSQMEPFEVSLQFDGRKERLSAFQLVVGNGLFHGAGSRVAPGATLDDAALDLYAIVDTAAKDGGSRTTARTLAMLARIGSRLTRGTHVEHPSVLHFKTTKVKVKTVPPLEVDVDGEICGKTPVTFSVAPAALSVVVPAAARSGRARS